MKKLLIVFVYIVVQNIGLNSIYGMYSINHILYTYRKVNPSRAVWEIFDTILERKNNKSQEEIINDLQPLKDPEIDGIRKGLVTYIEENKYKYNEEKCINLFDAILEELKY